MGEYTDMKMEIILKEGVFERVSDKEDSPGYLIGSKCKSCGWVHFPPKAICVKCYKEDMMGNVRLSQKGKIYSYTIIRQAPQGFTAPYATLYVDLPEKVRIFSPSFMTDWGEEPIEIEREVEVVIGKIKEDERGNAIIGYKFRPTSKDKS